MSLYKFAHHSESCNAGGRIESISIFYANSSCTWSLMLGIGSPVVLLYLVVAIPIMSTGDLGDVVDDCDVVIDRLVSAALCLGSVLIIELSFEGFLIKLCANLACSALL